MKKTVIPVLLAAIILLCPWAVLAKNAIILASFGTTKPEALTAITTIESAIRKAFPKTEIRLTFTSTIIRAVWKKRQADAEVWLAKGVPREVLYVKGVLATFGDLQEQGYTSIVVQPTHMFHMEQFQDLTAWVDGISSIRTIKERWRPFHSIVMGRPALGTLGEQYNYHNDLARAVRIFGKDVELARSRQAALVYMGHGNDYWSTGIYGELQKAMRQEYPDVLTLVGCVEGYPSLDDVKLELQHTLKPSDRILLKPLMIVAGDHALSDMAGPRPDSWKNVLEGLGFNTIPVLQGLGSDLEFAQIFVDNIRDAARDGNIELQ